MSTQLPDPISPKQFSGIFEPRNAAGHKGTFGSTAIVGGAQGMTGAAVLASRMALKAGSGRVYMGLAQQTTEILLDIVQPEVMSRPFESLMQICSQITAWGVGCGLGADAYALNCLRTVFSKRNQAPLVVDADALNALARGDVSPTWGSGTVVLTPHPTEAARLLGCQTDQVNQSRPEAASTLARQFKAWVVLKGQHTIVSSPQGQCQINPTGNVGLATAGTGDVLTGLTTSLLAQGFGPEVAVPAAVWLHGAAADKLAAEHGGTIGLTATELIDAVRSVRNQHPH